MLNIFKSYNNQYPWHKVGVLVAISSVWLLIYREPFIAAIVSFVMLFSYLYAVKIFNGELKNIKNSILKGLEEDSSDIIRNIVTNSKDNIPEENQFSNLITRLLSQYPRTADVPFYFFIDSDVNTNKASIDNLLKKSGLVSIVDPGIDNRLEACQSNVDHYYFDWWFTSKGVIVDLSVLLDGRDVDELNAGLVQISNLINFIKQFGRNVIKGMIYTISANDLKADNHSAFNKRLVQMTTVAKTISKNLKSPLNYNLLIQNSQEIDGFSDFSESYSDAGHFSPIGSQFNDNEIETGLLSFTDSLNAFMLLMLRKNNKQLCHSQGDSGFVHNISQLYPAILNAAKSLSDVPGKPECKGFYFIDAGQSIESDLRDPNSQYYGKQHGQSNSAALRIMLSNITKMSDRTLKSSIFGTISSSLLLISGLSILSYMFVDNYTKIKSMEAIPTKAQLLKSRSLGKKNASLIDKALRLIAYSVSSQVLAVPVSTGSASVKTRTVKIVAKNMLSKNATINDVTLSLDKQPLYLYLLRAAYSSVRQQPALPVLQAENANLVPFLQSPKSLVIPFEFTKAGYSIVRQNLDIIITLYVKESRKIRKIKGMQTLEAASLRDKIVSLHINAHVNNWVSLLKSIKFKSVSNRSEAKNVLTALANKQEFSIYLKILADHHLPSYNNLTVDQFKDFLEKIDNSYNHLSQIKKLAKNIMNPKLDASSRIILKKIEVTGQHNPLQKSYLQNIESSILGLLKITKIVDTGGTQGGDEGKKTSGNGKVTGPGTKVKGEKVTVTGTNTNTNINTNSTNKAGVKVKGTAESTGGTNTKLSRSGEAIGGENAVKPNQNSSINIRSKLIAEWNKGIYQFCARSIRRRYPVAYRANSTIRIRHFKQYFGSRGKIQSFYQNKLKQYIIVSRGPYRWNNAGKDLKLGNRILRHIEAVQTIKRAWFRNGVLQLNINLKPEFLSRNAVRFELTLGRSYIGYERRGKRYKRLRWTANGRDWMGQYAFINEHDDLIEGNFPRNKWFWVRFMNRTLRGRNGLVDIQDRGFRMLLHLERTRSAVNQFKVINNYSCLKL